MTTRPGYVWDDAASEFVAIGQAAVLAPIAYQASQPSSPATGDIWIDSDDDVPSVDSTLYYRWTKTMSGGETSLSGTDNNSLSLQYTPGYESVFINGVLQVRNLDYTATSGSTISGLTALASNDIVMVESIVAYSVGDTYTQSTLNTMFSPITTTGLVLLNKTTFTTQASVSFNDVFSATYNNYLIHLNITGSTTITGVDMRLRVGGADNSSTIYARSQLLQDITTVTGSRNTNQTSWASVAGIEGSHRTFSQLTVTQPFASLHSGMVGDVIESMNSGVYQKRTSWGTNVTTSFTGFTLFPGLGTMTGTVAVYGYK